MFRHTNITSPVDGKIVAIEPIDIQHNKYKIFIKVSKLNLNFYAPISGYIKIKEYQNGLNIEPLTLKGTMLNTKILFNIDDLKFEIYSGLCSPDVRINEKYIRKDESIGTVLDGLVIIYLSYKPNVKLNMQVIAKETIL
jgi:hypothetical protein